MIDATRRSYRKNFRNLNGHNVYGVFDRHSRRGVRLANDQLVVGNSKALDDVEIVLGLP